MEKDLKFLNFLKKITNENLSTNTTATGTATIQQSERNNLRKEGVAALKEDLIAMYGNDFDILETKDGLVIAAENRPGGWTFSWELKSTIKSIDYDPFIEANNYDDEVAAKLEKKLRKEAELEAKLIAKAANRKAKLDELQRRGTQN